MTSAPPPGQGRRTFTERGRREQIVRGAIVTINELGYHGASLAEIARRSGVAKSALAYYFGSKDALMVQVADEVFGALGKRIEAAVQAQATPTTRLLAYSRSYLQHILAHRDDLAAALDVLLSHRGDDGVPLYQVADEEDLALLRGILRDGIEAGEFRRMPLEAAVTIVNGLLDLAIPAARGATLADLKSLAQEVEGVILRGLGIEAH